MSISLLLDHFGFRYVFNVLLISNLFIDHSMSRCPMMFLTRYLKYEYMIRYCTKDLIELITMMFLSSWTVACSLSCQIWLVISNFITLSHTYFFRTNTLQITQILIIPFVWNNVYFNLATIDSAVVDGMTKDDKKLKKNWKIQTYHDIPCAQNIGLYLIL